ncbi:MAG TPA: hypothetical protein VGN23_09675 [Verrucomicrobiae bacterium]|jgi:hypothetical protein
MKKEGIAIYLGLSLYMVTFVVSAFLDSTGHKHQSRIGIAVSLILLGATMMAGIYSNVKNYGYLWMNVRQQDRSLSFKKLNKKYPKKGKGTWQYCVIIRCVALVALSLITAGIVLLIRNMG